MKYKIFLFSILLAVTVSSGWAHAIWIETNNVGTIGKAQEIKIYYGEYPAGEFEATDSWYSDVSAFTLWLTTPEGTKEKLEYKPVDKAFAATFTPDKEGVYTLTINHSAKEPGGTTIYQFNASAVVTVKESPGGNPQAIIGNELYLLPVLAVTGNKGVVKAFYKGKPAPNIAITVSGPSGWNKNFVTDENGVLEFELLWKGRYALEGFFTTQENGIHFEKPYEEIWRCATLLLTL